MGGLSDALFSQKCPEKSGGQRQLCWKGLAGSFTQVPPLWQVTEHLCSFSQRGPLKPGGHWHSGWPLWCRQLPPFRQRSPPQLWFCSSAHVDPV